MQDIAYWKEKGCFEFFGLEKPITKKVKTPLSEDFLLKIFGESYKTRATNRVHLHSRNGSYDIVSISADMKHLTLDCARLRYQNKTFTVHISDFKCFHQRSKK